MLMLPLIRVRLGSESPQNNITIKGFREDFRSNILP